MQTSLDLRLFVQIMNDSQLRGSQLQGDSLARSCQVFEEYLRTFPSKSPLLPSYVHTLLDAFPKLIEKEKALKAFERMEPFDASVSNIMSDILSLTENGLLLLPGGWTNKSGPGHAMIYAFTRPEKNLLQFAIYNSGAGISYHKQLSTAEKITYSPLLIHTLPVESFTRGGEYFIRKLLIARSPNLHKTNNQFDSKRLYEHIIPKLTLLSATQVEPAISEDFYTGSQLSGTCTSRVLHQLFKVQFDTLENYQRFIYGFKRYVCERYVQTEFDNKKLGQKTIRSQLHKAITNTLKILAVPNLFEPEKLEEENAFFCALRKKIEDYPIQETVQKNRIYQTPPAFKIPEHKNQSYSSPSPRAKESPYSTRVPITIPGGDCLLTDLQALMKHCEELAQENKYTSIFEQLENVFISMPFIKTGAFYSGISTFQATLAVHEVLFKLQDYYISASKALWGPVFLPRMLVSNLSFIAILGHLEERYPLIQTGYQNLVIVSALSRFLETHKNDVCFATNNPILDLRLGQIKEKYAVSEAIPGTILQFYQAIICSEQELHSQLETLYEQHASKQPPFHNDLKRNRLEALYYLSQNLHSLPEPEKFAPLIKKIQYLLKLEVAYAKALIPIHTPEDENMTLGFTIGFFGTKKNPYIITPASLTLHKTKLCLSKFSTQLSPALKLANPEAYFQMTANTRRRSNHIQLYPSEQVQKPEDLVLGEIRQSKYGERRVTLKDISEREEFHLRLSKKYQIPLTLKYFVEHLDKLDKEYFQIYLEANIFEPGLLMDALDTYPELLNSLDLFVEKGLQYYTHEGLLTKPGLFFIRFLYLVQSYAAAYDQHKWNIGDKLQKTQSLITFYLGKNPPTEIFAELHLYQFLCALARLQIQEQSQNKEALVALALGSYFYYRAKNRLSNYDAATRADFHMAEQSFRRFSEKYFLKGALLEVIKLLQFEISAPVIEGHYPEFTIRSDSTHQRYILRVDTGLVFDQDELSYSVIPLALTQKPVFTRLGLQNETSAFQSKDGKYFKIPSKNGTVLFIEDPNNLQPTRIQKEIFGEWYEWLATRDQRDLPLPKLEADLPKILTERDRQFWISCKLPNTILLLGEQLPMYRYRENNEWSLLENDRDSAYKLIKHPQWVVEQLGHFEDLNFITVLEHNQANTWLIRLDRYGISLEAKKDAQLKIKQINSNLELVVDAPPFALGTASLTFINPEGQLFYFLAIQGFIRSKQQQDLSQEYYFLEHDISHYIAEKTLDNAENREANRSWQYTGSANYFCIPIEQEEPKPQSVKEALYLAYIYLATHQPEKAWAMLVVCQSSFTGLSGNLEELQFIYWITHKLPFTFSNLDEEAEIKTPPVVACQLKSLALLAEFLNQEGRFDFSAKIKNEKKSDANAKYERCSHNQVVDFYDTLDSTFSEFYSIYQRMRRHTAFRFLLRGEELQQILQRYTNLLPENTDKTLGSIAYEKRVLELRQLKIEYGKLKALGSDPSSEQNGYLDRQKKIKSVLEKQPVRAQHTRLRNERINLALPETHQWNIRKLSPKAGEAFGIYNRGLSKEHPGNDLNTAITALQIDICRDTFLLNFRIYYWLANHNESPEFQASLKEFCSKFLLAKRHISPQKKSSSILWVLSNILYRFISMSNCRSLRDFQREPIESLEAAINRAWKIDPPSLMTLKESSVPKPMPDNWAIWKSLPKITTQPMPPCPEVELDDSVTVALKGPEFTALIDFLKLYKNKTLSMQTEIAKTPDNEEGEAHAGNLQLETLQELQTLANTSLKNKELLKKLSILAENCVNKLGLQLKKEWDAILSLANEGPENQEARARWKLETAAEIRPSHNQDTLFPLYLSQDFAEYARATELSRPKAERLHFALHHYLIVALQMQQWQRILMQGELIQKENSDCYPLAQALSAENCCKNDPLLTVFQYLEKILLYPDQIKCLPRGGIEKMPMNTGKSKVISPLKAQRLADGTKLLIFIVPDSLFNTNFNDAHWISMRLFNQKVRKFSFDRKQACSSKIFKNMYWLLETTLREKAYLVTTKNSMQSLELKFLELLILKNYKNQSPKELKEEEKQYKTLSKIIRLLRERCEVVIDESHLGLSILTTLNYTIGETKELPNFLILECLKLYDFFKNVSLACLANPQFKELNLKDVLNNNLLISEESDWQLIMEELKTQILFAQASPMKGILQRLSRISEENIGQTLLQYFNQQGSDIPDCLRLASPEDRELVELYRIQITLLLPHTLKSKPRVNYGPSKLIDQGSILSARAIPYSANNKPKEGSEFANCLETINYTIQYMLIHGVKGSLLYTILERLQNSAAHELRFNSNCRTINDTNTARDFMSLCPILSIPFSSIAVENKEQFQQLQGLLRHYPPFLNTVIEEVLKTITIQGSILGANAIDLVAMFGGHVQGFSGTPYNAGTYHQALTVSQELGKGSDGSVLAFLKKTQTKIHSLDFTTAKPFLETLFSKVEPISDLRALLDVSASFRGIPNLTLARILSEIIPRFIPNIEYILYFNESDILCAMELTSGRIVTLGTSEATAINNALHCTPNERFTLYDHPHTVGVDLKQGKNAIALAFVDQIPLSGFLQACLRMRGLFDNGQRIEICVPSSLKNCTLEDLIFKMRQREIADMQKENFTAAVAKLKALIRNQCIKLLLDNGSFTQNKNLAQGPLRPYLATEQRIDLFEQYGGQLGQKSTKNLLEVLKKELLNDWKNRISAAGIPYNEDALESLSRDMEDIIGKSLPLCSETNNSFISLGQSTEKEMQTEKEVDTTLTMLTQQQNDFLSKEPRECAFDKWTNLDLSKTLLSVSLNKLSNFKSLNDLCKTHTPYFGNIYAHKNYFQCYDNQENYLNSFLKPIHALLFWENSDKKIYCLILSNEEAEALIIPKTYPKLSAGANIWISTSSHFVLAGTRPCDMLQNREYQLLIEQILFFNGNFQSFLQESEPLLWLTKKTNEKMAFFEQYLLNSRETNVSDVQKLKTMLTLSKGFEYISAWAHRDLRTTKWVELFPEFSPRLCELLKKLANAFFEINQCFATLYKGNIPFSNPDDFINRSGVQEIKLPVQAMEHIRAYVEKLALVYRLHFTIYNTDHDPHSEISASNPIPDVLNCCLPNYPDHRTLFFEAILKGYLKSAAVMLQKGVDISAKNALGDTPIITVLKSNISDKEKTILWLLDHGAIPDFECKEWTSYFQSLTADNLWQLYQHETSQRNKITLDSSLSFLTAVTKHPTLRPRFSKALTIGRQTNTELSKIMENIEKLQALKKKIETTAKEYIDYSKKNCRFSLFHRHGEAGQKRVMEWLNSLDHISEPRVLQEAIINYLSRKENGNTYPHSFKTLMIKKLLPEETSHPFSQLLSDLKNQWEITMDSRSLERQVKLA